MIFNLPYPISTNAIWRNTSMRGRRVTLMSKPAREWKKAAMWVAKNQYRGQPLKGPFEARITVHPKNDRLIDLDNCCKLALDSLQGIAYEDDKQCEVLIVRRGEQQEGGGMTIEVFHMKQNGAYAVESRP